MPPTHRISGGSVPPTHWISGGSGSRIWRTFVSLQPPNSLRGCKQTADIIKIFNFSYLATLYYINVSKYLQFLNFLNFAEDTKRLVGLRLAMAAGKNLDMAEINCQWTCLQYLFRSSTLQSHVGQAIIIITPNAVQTAGHFRPPSSLPSLFFDRYFPSINLIRRRKKGQTNEWGVSPCMMFTLQVGKADDGNKISWVAFVRG